LLGIFKKVNDGFVKGGHTTNKRKSNWNKHTKKRSGKQYDAAQNAKRGSKNQKFKPSPNPNKKKQ
jgi:hypothetical protein